MHQAAVYRKANSLQRECTGRIVEEFKDELAKFSERCLDVGSGTGDVMIDIVLPKMNPNTKIFCSDISDAMLDFNKAQYGYHERILAFEKLDIQTSDLPNKFIGQFDYITSFYCLQWCQNLSQAFKNIFDILRSGGSIFATFVATCPFYSAYPILATYPRYHSYVKDYNSIIPVLHSNNQPLQTLETLVKSIGFEVLHLSLRQTSHFYRTSDELKEFLISINPFITRMPPDLREDYGNDLLKEASKFMGNNKNNNEEDYGFLQTHQMFVVYLKKP
ncbi:juvenile hormone acid O-methyltransferase-like [Athalia rosae]|uniref:juvenile hormone acid O-methyltransferase-like n=1 Tax=Athalia rosae TaxID=37344 RepID=UPI002033FE94|nr:juvenile hormone acid O-methyltransferase-like [Athalia rosae]